jgi:hypothetical protein
MSNHWTWGTGRSTLTAIKVDSLDFRSAAAISRRRACLTGFDGQIFPTYGRHVDCISSNAYILVPILIPFTVTCDYERPPPHTSS